MKLRLESEKPIYIQLCEWLSDMIISGTIPEGEQIPSTTEISVEYKVNPATALKGINMLVDKGVIFKKRGLGMFVSSGAVENSKQKDSRIFSRPTLTKCAQKPKSLAYQKMR